MLITGTKYIAKINFLQFNYFDFFFVSCHIGFLLLFGNNKDMCDPIIVIVI
jgi:hypothetical protein